MRDQTVIKSCIVLSIFVLLSCGSRENLNTDFQIEPGFDLTLVAREPLIQDPVDLEFNERGDALVLEMPGYPLEDKQSRIKVLKDNDHDGVFDEEILLAENLLLASSILPYKNGVLVCAPPFLLYLIDKDQNYKVEQVDTLMGGFAMGNLQHNFNGLTYGLDNWIYAVNGGNSGKPFWWGDSTSVMDLRGEDLRFNLDKKLMERIGKSSGGFGLGVDEYGRLFETHNLTHISHLVFPERYSIDSKLTINNALTNISDHEENGLARIYPIGEQESRVNHPEQSGYFSGSCGITFYGGGAFGPGYENTVWVADVVLNLIHVDRIIPSGSSFIATRVLHKKDFLASKDRSFRPVNMTTGPDGSLYVVDMNREVIEHPEWIPDELEKDMDLNAGKDKGRIYKINKTGEGGSKYNPDKMKSSKDLIQSLNSPNQWIRKTAHRLLVDNQLEKADVESLGHLLQSKNKFSRLHAMWILKVKGQLSGDQLLLMLNDSISSIRENALIVAENFISSNEKVLSQCIILCNDKDQRVRMQAALTISTIAQPLFDAHRDAIQKALLATSSNVNDSWNVAAITLAAKYSPIELFKMLSASTDGIDKEKLLQSLAFLAKDKADVSSILETLREYKFKDDVKAAIINQLIKKNYAFRSSNSLLPAIQSLEETKDLKVISALASLRNNLKLLASSEFLKYSRAALSKVLDYNLADSTRYQQLSLLTFLPYSEKATMLFQCIKNSEPLAIQEAALQQLNTYTQVEIGKNLVKQWKELGPQTRRLAGDVLLYKEIYHDALLTGLENGTINIGEMNFDLERRRRLLWWTDDENTKKRAEKLFSDVGVVNRKEAIEKMKPALSLTGSPIKGDEVFKNICSQCHVYGKQGNEVGPVLTEISRKSKEVLLHDILDPNSAVNTKYINHRLETKNGEVHIGIVDSETDHEITIKKMGGSKVTVNKSEIKDFTSLGKSLMMEGLEGSISTQDMADLLSYLQSVP